MSPKDHTEAKQLPKTGETESSLATLFSALATATGLVFLAKRKKDEEERLPSALDRSYLGSGEGLRHELFHPYARSQARRYRS